MENERRKRIKNLVVERNIGKSPRTGDQYRVLSRQINEIIRLLSENGELSLLPVDGMTDSEIADIIHSIINRPENREFISRLKIKGIKSVKLPFIIIPKDNPPKSYPDDTNPLYKDFLRI